MSTAGSFASLRHFPQVGGKAGVRWMGLGLVEVKYGAKITLESLWTNWDFRVSLTCNQSLH